MTEYAAVPTMAVKMTHGVRWQPEGPTLEGDGPIPSTSPPPPPTPGSFASLAFPSPCRVPPGSVPLDADGVADEGVQGLKAPGRRPDGLVHRLPCAPGGGGGIGPTTELSVRTVCV